MKYEILLLSILIVASYSSTCTDTDIDDPQSGIDSCEGLATTTNSGSTCCEMSFSTLYGGFSRKCFEHKLTKTYSTDITKLNEIAEAFLKNKTNASYVSYKCKTGEGDDKYDAENYGVTYCSAVKNPTSGDTCAAAYNDSMINLTGSHCCLLDYEYSATLHSGSGFTSPSGKTCIDISNDDYKNITDYIDEEGVMHDDDDDDRRRRRHRRHLSDDEEEITIKRFNVNCGTGKPAGQSDGKTISGVTNSAKSGTTGITGASSDAKSLKTGVMILILSLLI